MSAAGAAGRRLARRARRHLLRGAAGRRDAQALQALAAVAPGYMPWSRMAMRPAAVAGVLNDIVLNRRRNVVECGSGISTLCIARVLSERGGRLTSVEDDPGWAEWVAGELAAHELDRVVSIVVAPLEPTPLGAPGGRWYADAALAPIRAAGGIDLLVVDGPAACRRELGQARYPALPYFSRSLAPSCTIVLDDVHRRGENEVVDRWEAEHDIRFERRYAEGVAIGRRGPGFIA
jgi:predicted O-methyltransferase YrrM